MGWKISPIFHSDKKKVRQSVAAYGWFVLARMREAGEGKEAE